MCFKLNYIYESIKEYSLHKRNNPKARMILELFLSSLRILKFMLQVINLSRSYLFMEVIRLRERCWHQWKIFFNALLGKLWISSTCISTLTVFKSFHFVFFQVLFCVREVLTQQFKLDVALSFMFWSKKCCSSIFAVFTFKLASI